MGVRSPIWTFCNWIPVVGYPRDSHVNYVRFNGFLRNVSYSFQNFWKALKTFLLKRSSHRTFLISKFVIDFEIPSTITPLIVLHRFNHYYKHAKQSFITIPNTAAFVKNTRLCIILYVQLSSCCLEMWWTVFPSCLILCSTFNVDSEFHSQNNHPDK